MFDFQAKENSIIRELQVTLGALQASHCAMYDPTPLIQRMELATSIQQDAQEFYKGIQSVSGAYLRKNLQGQFLYPFCRRSLLNRTCVLVTRCFILLSLSYALHSQQQTWCLISMKGPKSTRQDAGSAVRQCTSLVVPIGSKR